MATANKYFYGSDRFVDIIRKSKDFDDAYNKIHAIKDVPPDVADAFYKKYNPDENLSMKSAFKKLYDDVKSENRKSMGGMLVGSTDKNGGKGIKVVAPEGNIIMGGGEAVICEEATKKHCEELSRINQSGGGVAIPCEIKDIANTTDSKMKAGDVIKKSNKMFDGGKINEDEATEMMWVLKKDGPTVFHDKTNIEIADELVKRGVAEKENGKYALTKKGEMNLMKDGGKIESSKQKNTQMANEVKYGDVIYEVIKDGNKYKIISKYDSGTAEQNFNKYIDVKRNRKPYIDTDDWRLEMILLNLKRFEKKNLLQFIPNETIEEIYDKYRDGGAINKKEGGVNISKSAIEEGKKVELEHASTINKIKNNPKISTEDAAELIAKDHLEESPDYYKKLKIMERNLNSNKKQNCNCPTMQYHNKLSEDQREMLGDRYISVGTTITDNKSGLVSEIIDIKHNGFEVAPQTSFSGSPKAPFTVPFEEFIERHKRGDIKVSGYGNTPDDHTILVLVVKDVMASNIINEFAEEQVAVSTMASGGIVGEVKAGNNGVVKEVRDSNGKILNKVYVGDTLYTRNTTYKTYNSETNELLYKQDADKIHLAYGGIVGTEELPNYYRVDISSPKNVKLCRVPKWAQDAAGSVKKGAKVTTCKKYNKWFLSSILIPKDGITSAEAEDLGREIKDKIENKKMSDGGSVYETGATSSKVNNLILFADTTRDLAEMRDAINTTIKSRISKGANPTQEELENRFKTFLVKTKGQYVREMGNTKESRKQVDFTEAEDKEFLRLYAEDINRESGEDSDVIKATNYWNGLTPKQRSHFLLDHADYVFDKPVKDIPTKELNEYKKLASQKWSGLPKEVALAVEEHVISGTYASGGELGGYTPKESNYLMIDDDINLSRDAINVLIESSDSEEEKEALRSLLNEYQN